MIGKKYRNSPLRDLPTKLLAFRDGMRKWQCRAANHCRDTRSTGPPTGETPCYTVRSMNSRDIEELTVWESWPDPALARAPNKPGLYVFRIACEATLPRVKGQSDIVYIGTNRRGKGTIRSRLNWHKCARSDETNRLHRISKEHGSLEVA